MKCVKHEETGEVRRVSDDAALEMVQAGWRYVPKQTWKAAGRP